MNFLYGTYGFDLLSIFLLFVSTFFNFNRYTRIFSIIITFVAIWRAFSKNKGKREKEMNTFINILNKIIKPFKKKIPANLPRVSLLIFPMLYNQAKLYFKERKDFKIVKCPKCNQKLRLPRKKGNIVVRCKKCNHKFDLKT